MDMRNARTEENKRLFSREEWLKRNQFQSYFSRLSALKRKLVSGPPCNQPGLVDTDDLIQEDDWIQQVGEVYEKLSVQHPIYYDAYNLCDLQKRKMISSFNVEMLQTLCKHFGITFKSKDRKQVLVDEISFSRLYGLAFISLLKVWKNTLRASMSACQQAPASCPWT